MGKFDSVISLAKNYRLNKQFAMAFNRNDSCKYLATKVSEQGDAALCLHIDALCEVFPVLD
jgi:hypothetical protein